MNIIINKFFVYGSLRPDINAPWSSIVHKNKSFDLKYYKSYLENSKLYHHKEIGYAVTLHDKNNYSKEDKTFGYILESNNIEESLKLFDEIEEYPEVYERYVVKCFNLENNKEEDAYFYSMRLEKIKQDQLEFTGFNDYKLYLSKYSN
jgi:gamma-glutamylcyclotransferase (GGCT)/AIG2-like uncharacterized protein YtfP